MSSPAEPRPVGRVESPLADPSSAPMQGDEGARLRVSGLEAVDGTPILDIKPALSGDPRDR